MNQTGDDVTIFDVEVVVRSVHVGWDDRCEVAAIFIFVAPVHHVNHALRVRIPLVGSVRRATVHHCFIDWVRGLVREDASAEA